jgi:hypothetical protein
MMDAALRAFVRERAERRCEYCQPDEEDSGRLSFQIEHIIARQHGGTDEPEALCYACAQCNWAKGPNLAGMLAGKLYPLFNPRKQSWRVNGQDENRDRHDSSAQHKRACKGDVAEEPVR